MCHVLLLSSMITGIYLLISDASICCIRESYASEFALLWADGTKSSGVLIECGTRPIDYHLCYKEHSRSLFPLRTACVGVRIWRPILRPVSRDLHVDGPLIHLPVCTLVRACRISPRVTAFLHASSVFLGNSRRVSPAQLFHNWITATLEYQDTHIFFFTHLLYIIHRICNK
jgi:hypothetical protein